MVVYICIIPVSIRQLLFPLAYAEVSALNRSRNILFLESVLYYYIFFYSDYDMTHSGLLSQLWSCESIEF